VTCAWSGQDSSSASIPTITLIGSDTGMVYEMDRGTSFDGSAIEAYLRLPFFHNGTPTQRKKWSKATLELDCIPSANIYVSADFSYGDPDTDVGSPEQLFTVQGGGGFWNQATWNNFTWSQPYVGKAFAPIQGVGTPISLSIYSNTIWDQTHTFHGVTFGLAPRGQER
jgi:hypothetical protein